MWRWWRGFVDCLEVWSSRHSLNCKTRQGVLEVLWTLIAIVTTRGSWWAVLAGAPHDCWLPHNYNHCPSPPSCPLSATQPPRTVPKSKLNSDCRAARRGTAAADAAPDSGTHFNRLTQPWSWLLGSLALRRSSGVHHIKRSQNTNSVQAFAWIHKIKILCLVWNRPPLAWVRSARARSGEDKTSPIAAHWSRANIFWKAPWPRYPCARAGRLQLQCVISSMEECGSGKFKICII